MRPAAPALGSGHLFSHQTRSRAGKQGDSKHSNSGKTRSQSSPTVTCAPGQNEAHTKALAGSAPRVPHTFGATWHLWQRRSPAEAGGEWTPASSGRQAATQKQCFVRWENDPPSPSCREGLGSTAVRASEPGRLAFRGWKQSPTQMNTPEYIKKYCLPA